MTTSVAAPPPPPPSFPNIGVSLSFLRRILNDERLAVPACSLPVVCDGILQNPATDLDAMDDVALLALAKQYRVFSAMGGGEEFGRYSGEIPTTRTAVLDVLRRPLRTTSQVCECICKPDTLEAGCSYAEMLTRDGDSERTDEVGAPTLFLSHAWRYNFCDLVSAVLDSFANKSDEERAAARVWNDVFVEDQNSSTAKPKEYWYGAFQDAIKHIGSTLFVLAPWHAPIAITRSWCIWEVFSSLRCDADFEIALVSSERAAFERALEEDLDSIVVALSEVDAANAEAFDEGDKRRIDEAIRASIGFKEVNSVISKGLRLWIARTAREAVQRRRDEAVARDDDLGADDDVDHGLSHAVAALLMELGEVKEAEAMQRGDFARCERIFGANHANTCNVAMNLASSCLARGAIDCARSFFQHALLGYENAAESSNHRRIAVATSGLGIVAQKTGALDEAAALFRSALVQLDRAASDAAEDSRECAVSRISVLHNLAGLLGDMGKGEDAVAEYRKCLAMQRDLHNGGVAGNKHPRVLAEMACLAAALMQVAVYDDEDSPFLKLATGEPAVAAAEEADTLLTQARAGYEVVLGEAHPETLATVSKLAGLSTARGDIEKAERLYRAAAAGLALSGNQEGRLHTEQSLFLILLTTRAPNAEGRVPEADALLLSSPGLMAHMMGGADGSGEASEAEEEEEEKEEEEEAEEDKESESESEAEDDRS